MSARKELSAALKSMVPKRWKILDADRNLDSFSVITVLVSQREIRPAPNAQGNHRATLYVYVIDPRTVDESATEDSLDDATDTVLFSIDESELSIRWTLAEKVVYQGHRAYRITAEVMTQKKE